MSRRRIQDLKQQVERINALSGVTNRNAENIEYTLESLQDYLDDLGSSMSDIRDTTTKLTCARKNIIDTIVEVETIQGKFASILETKDALSGKKGQQLLLQSPETYHEKVTDLLEQRSYFQSSNCLAFKSTPEILTATQASCLDIVSCLESEYEKSLKAYSSPPESSKATAKTMLMFSSGCLHQFVSALLPDDHRSGVDRCRAIYTRIRSDLNKRLTTDWMTSRKISSSQHIIQENDRLWSDWIMFIVDEMLQSEYRIWTEFSSIFHDDVSVLCDVTKEIMAALLSSVSPLILTSGRRDKKKKRNNDDSAFNFSKFSLLMNAMTTVLSSFHNNTININKYLMEEDRYNGVDLRSPSMFLFSSSSSSSLFQLFVSTRSSIQLRLLMECNDMLIWLKESEISPSSSYCGVDIITSQSCLEVIEFMVRFHDIIEDSLKCAIYDDSRSTAPIVALAWQLSDRNHALIDLITHIMLALCSRIDKRSEMMKLNDNSSSIKHDVTTRRVDDDDDELSLSNASDVPTLQPPVLPPPVIFENPLAAAMLEEPQQQPQQHLRPSPFSSATSSIGKIFSKEEEKKQKLIQQQQQEKERLEKQAAAASSSGGLFSVFHSSTEKAAAVIASQELIDIDIVFRMQLPRLFFLLNNYHYLLQFSSKSIAKTSINHFLSTGLVQRLRSNFSEFMRELCKTFSSHLLRHVKDLSDLPSPSSLVLSKSDGRKVKGRFECCNVFFEAIQTHAPEWIVQDLDLKTDIRRNLIQECVPLYTNFYFSYSQLQFSKKHMREYLRFPPNQAETLLNALF